MGRHGQAGTRFQPYGSYAEIHDRGWVVRDEDGRPVRMVGAMEDVTYQKEAERELRRQSDALRMSEARLQELADAMPHVVWTAKPDGTVDYLNRRSQEYDGFIWTENEGWSWINSVHPDDREAGHRYLGPGSSDGRGSPGRGTDLDGRWKLPLAPCPYRPNQGS